MVEVWEEETMERHKTREIRIGNRVIGGSNPIAIQSMCNTKTENVTETVEQIHRLERAGIWQPAGIL